MKKYSKVIATVIVIIMVVLSLPGDCYADNIYTVRVPIDATMSVRGAILTENNLIATELASGRIHDIAVGATGIVYGYKYYTVSNLTGMQDLIVYDRNMVPLTPINIDVENRLIEYSDASPDFILKYSERIRGAAIAYHNRTGGYGESTFYTYFLRGSDAAIKCELSDSGRYWGQFVKARIIEGIEILEVTPYGDSAFTTKVRIIADGSGYIEDYTINFLFINNGTNFYVSNFTFMK